MGHIIGPVLGIRDEPLLGDYFWMLLWRECECLERLTDSSELILMDVILDGDESCK